MSSDRNWREAQLACGRLWAQIGIAFAIVTVAAFAVLYATGNRDTGTWQGLSLVFALVPIIGMLWSYVRVEQHLRSLDATISRTT
jgi:Na+/melibiose symporter-like transporter